MRVRVAELTTENGGRGVAVRRALFKAIVFLHGLIIQILAVYDKKHLVDIRQHGCLTRRLEGGQRFAGTGRMPDIAAALNRAGFLIIMGDFDAVQNALGCRDLIRTHDEQQLFRCKYAVFGQNIQQRVPCEERPREVHQIGNGTVLRVRPEGRKFKAVAGFSFAGRSGFCAFDGVVAGTVGIILGIRSVGNDEDLHILKQSAS